jgi:hypothetical protein
MRGRLIAAIIAIAGATAVVWLAAAARGRDGAPPPRTSDGRPDFQGYWTNDSYTPLERPSDLAGRERFSSEEAAAYLKERHDDFLAQPRANIHYDDAIWQGEPYDKVPNLQTSLIVEPRDGKIPPLTPEATARAAARAADNRARAATNSFEARSLAERCISWGNVGPPMVPPSYNANLQILQTSDHVIIRHEMIHEDRIVPLDGRPHLAGGIRLLAGDSRGRWDGDTLVVDTTNFTGKTNFRGAPRHTRQDIVASDTLHVVERFTLVDRNTIRYQFTVEDAAMWTEPWSGELPIRRFGGPLFEYACHEGNYGLPNILRAARVREDKAAEAPRSTITR